MSQNLITKIYRYVWVSAWYAFAVVMVLLATSFAVARLLLPFADQYSAEVSKRFSDYVDQPVLVRALDAEWHGWGPSLVLRDVALLDVEDGQPVFQLEKIRLGFDLLSSLNLWQPVFSQITLVGVDLKLSRDRQGQFSVKGFSRAASLAGDANDAATLPGNNSPFLDWLFSQGQLGLEKSNITWHDEMGAGHHMQFSAVNLSLRNDGDRHQLDASVELTRDLGKSLTLRVDMRGNPLSVEQQHIQVYVAGEHLRLAELFEPQAVGGVDVSIKNAGFQVWGQWENGALQYLTGDVDVGGLSMLASAQTSMETDSAEGSQVKSSQSLLLGRVAGKFLWQQTKDGWQFDGDDMLLARESRQWQPARVSLNFSEQDDGSSAVDAAASYLQVKDISELLSLFSVGGEAVGLPLQAINPRGEIKNARLHWQGGAAPEYSAYATLYGATINAWRDIPAAENMDGQLWLDDAGGQVSLQHAAVNLDFPALFRWPLQIDELRGDVAWEVTDGQWRVAGRHIEASNVDVTATATLDVVQSAIHDSPFMSLVVDFKDGDGSQVPHYLPTGIMPKSAVNWLDEAFVSARVTSGGAVFHGHLADFPFDEDVGKFEVAFTVDNASLNYAKAWPPITNIKADVQFEGSGMLVDMHRGNIFSNEIRWAKVGIENMAAKPMLLTIDGEVEGYTQEKLDYVVVSPQLNAAFGESLDGMTATGESLLNLDLDLPIGTDDDVLVNGWVDLKENTLSIPSLGRVLGEVDGRLNFFQDGLQAENIQAELFGQSTQINIATTGEGADRNVRIKAGGLFNAPDLAAHYVPVLADLLIGDGDWNVVFDIPVSEKEKDNETEHQPIKNKTPARLSMRTSLKGVESRLPPPFNKRAEDISSLGLRVDFLPQQAPVMRVNYAGFADSIFTLGGMTRADDFHAAVNFNSGAAEMPDTPGLHVTGWLDAVSLDEWRNLVLSRESRAEPKQTSLVAEVDNATTVPEFVPKGGERLAGGGGLQILGSADVAVRVFEAYGETLHNARLKLHTEKTAVSANIEAKELKGHLSIPYEWQKNPIVADLDYAYLSKSESESSSDELDPREMPALDITVNDFRFGNSRFGKIRLETTRVADGVRIEQLVLQSKATTMTARGGWYARGDQQQSNLTMHVESSNVGKTLKALDYVGGIDKGKGSADLELSWPGSFADVDAQHIKGKLSMSLKDGYVLDVNPGAGRMFGLLSIQALPRRLLLDFSDVFKKGFGFDRMKGRFKIEDGDAYTNNFYMKGPAARVDISGRTGLAQQDYDQLVTVTPHVGDTLPVLGILTATPQIGVAILAVQKLFQPEIDDVARNQYTITGSWNAPVITKLKTTKPVADSVVDTAE